MKRKKVSGVRGHVFGLQPKAWNVVLLLICAIGVICGSLRAQSPPALVQVLDTLKNADGTKASGRLVISWDPFTTSDNATIDGGTLTYTILATGASAGVVNLSLAPNAGASPAGTSYRARYYLANGASYTETWVVPATGPKTIADVRVSIVPSPTVTFNAGTQLTNIDFTGQSYTRPIKTGTTLPASCAANKDLFIDSDASPGGQQLFLCNSAGTGWNLVGDAGGAGSGIMSLNGLTTTTQTFSRVNDSNVTLAITSSGGDHQFALGWSGALGLARGGTNQGSWTASRCVRVNDAGTAFESAAADCGGGGGPHNLLSVTHSDTATASPVLGDLLYANTTPAWTKLAGNTTAAKQFLTQTGTGSASAAPAWGTIADGDIPASITRDSEINVLGTANQITSSGSGPAPTLAIANPFTFPGKATFAAGAAGAASINIPSGSTPTTPVSGDLWQETGVPKFYNGSATKSLAFLDSNITGTAAGLSATLGLAAGGTNATSWTAARCVLVNAGGTALESAAADCGSGGGNHNLLSTTHPDTTAGTVARGDLVVGQGVTASWQRLALGAANRVLKSDGTDAAWGQVDMASSMVAGILGSANGGTGNGFTKFTGPTTAEKTFTLPDSSQTIETQNNKNAASGYAGLTASTKLTASQGQEVWALTDLSDVAITTPATAQTVRYNGSSWVNAALGCADVTNCASLVASGTAGNGASKAGTASTAARSDHDHRSIHSLTWYFAGTPGTGVQNLTLVFPEIAVNYSILDMRVTVNTTSASSSTFNLQRCTASCTGTTPTFANIYSTNLTLSANTRTAAKAAAPDQNVSGLAAGDQFKANLATIGSGLADVTVTMTYKYDTTN